MIELYNHPLFHDASLYAYYRLEGNITDSGPNSFAGGSTTNVTWGTSYGKYGQGVRFNGTSNMNTNSKIILSTSLQGPTDNWTYSYWFYTTNVSSWSPHFTNWNTQTSGRNIYIFRGGANDIGVDIPFIKGSVVYSDASCYRSSVWNHVALTRSGSTWKLYINGNLHKQVTDSIAQQVGTAAGFGYSGYNVYGTDYLDDFAIFTRALSDTEIFNFYNYPIGAVPVFRRP